MSRPPSLLLWLSFLVLPLSSSGCSSPPVLPSTWAPRTAALEQRLAQAADRLQNALVTAEPTGSDFELQAADAFAPRLAALHALSRFAASAQAALGSVATNQTSGDDPSSILADALSRLLVALSQDGQPDGTYMKPELRVRLVGRVRNASLSEAWHLSQLFSRHAQEVVAADLEPFAMELKALRQRALEAIDRSASADRSYREQLLARQASLRKAVVATLEEGLPPEWDPKKDLAAVEKLIAETDHADLSRRRNRNALAAAFDQALDAVADIAAGLRSSF